MMNILDYIKKTLRNNRDKLSFKIILFVLLFLLFFVLYYFNSKISLDEIWNYGFAYNISEGLVPYLDFNMIQTPLYFYLLGGLIKIFGNHFVMMIILNSFLSSVLQCLLIRKYGYKTLILFPCLFFSNFTCYNFLSLVLFAVLLNIDDEKEYSEYVKGFIISLMIFSKQTTGGILLIVLFLLSKNKKRFLIGFLPICILYLSYLIISNSVYQFFDYCLFSLLDFTGGNSFSSINWSVIFYVLMIILLVSMNIKSKFKNRDLVYILAFQVMSIPLFDFMHIIISAIPFMAYLVYEKPKKNMERYLSLVVVVFYITYIVFFTILYTIFTDSKVYYLKDSFLYGKRVSFNLQYIHNMLDDIEKEYSDRKIYHLYENAYLVKLEHNRTLDMYDLSLKGNMGYHGENRCIEDIKNNCSKQACLIIIDHDILAGSQISKKINDYVRDNYIFNKNLDDIDFYTN